MKACFIALVASFTCLTSATSQTSKTSHTSKASKTCILFTGDILLDRGVRTVIDKRGPDHLFSRSMDSLFKSSQVVVGNLECPATKIKAPVQKRFIFRAEPEWLTVLRKHGFTHLNLANNHAIDQGRQGLIDTKENIRKTDMTPIGAGYNMKEAAQPVLLIDKPRKVWLVPSLRLALENFTYLPEKACVSQEPMDSLILRIWRLKKKDPQAVICHHTHTLQTIEHYRGKPIYYSIGNFIFDQQKPLNSKACVVKVEVTKNQVKATTIPIQIKNCVPCITH